MVAAGERPALEFRDSFRDDASAVNDFKCTVFHFSFSSVSTNDRRKQPNRYLSCK